MTPRMYSPGEKLSTDSRLLISPNSLHFLVGLSVLNQAHAVCLSVSQHMLNLQVKEHIALTALSRSETYLNKKAFSEIDVHVPKRSGSCVFAKWGRGLQVQQIYHWSPPHPPHPTLPRRRFFTFFLRNLKGATVAASPAIFKALTLSSLWCPFADPLPPSRVEVNSERTASTALQVRWTPSPGKVTWYEVQLFDPNNQKIQEVQVQKSNTWSQYTFLNLTAGISYKIAITAVSGEKRSLPVYANGSTGKSGVVWG